MCIIFERFQARYQAVAFFTSDSVWGGGVGTLHRSTCLWEMAFTGQNQVSSTIQVDLFEIANIIFFHKCHFSNLCTGEWWEMPRSRHHYACVSPNVQYSVRVTESALARDPRCHICLPRQLPRTVVPQPLVSSQ